MTKKEFEDKVEKMKDNLSLIKTVVEQIGNYKDIYLITETRVIYLAQTYKDTLRLLKLIGRKWKPLPFKLNWYAAPVMVFSWESDQVELWLRVDPQEIPKELLGNCEVIEHVEEIVMKKIVCEVNHV